MPESASKPIQELPTRLAGFPFTLQFYDPALKSQAARQVPLARHAGARDSVTLMVLPPTRGAARARRRSMTVRLDGVGGYSGEFDPVTRRGWIRVAEDHPLEALLNALRRIVTLLVYREGGAVIHGAGVQRGRRLFIFFGPSGAGKTTVCELSPEAKILNDDLMAVRRVNGRARVWPMPCRRPAPARPPAGDDGREPALLIELRQARKTYLQRLPPALALARVLALPAEPSNPQATLEILERLVRQTPCYRLYFTRTPDFWGPIESLLANPRRQADVR